MTARLLLVAFSSFLVFSSCSAKKADIDKHENETITRLYSEQPSARNLLSRSYGYAVFNATQSSFAISGGGGTGIAVDRKTGKEFYMRMGSAGVGFGFGFQMLDVVILFQTKEKFYTFVNEGWDADTSASAAGGKEGFNKDSSFTNDVMVYQMTDKGLMAQASLKGTKYWKDTKLNK